MAKRRDWGKLHMEKCLIVIYELTTDKKKSLTSQVSNVYFSI